MKDHKIRSVRAVVWEDIKQQRIDEHWITNDNIDVFEVNYGSLFCKESVKMNRELGIYNINYFK